MNKKTKYATYWLAQLFFNLFFLQYFAFSHLRLDIVVVVIVFMLLEAGINIYFFNEMQRLLLQEQEAVIARLQFEQSRQIVQSFRSKHHDMINHFQVVMGLMQMGKNDQAQDYMRTIAKDLVQLEKLATLKRPEVAAIISTKLTELNYLRVALSIRSDLEFLIIRPDKMVSILGNLLDNAIFQASLGDDQWISLELYEESGWYYFEVGNPGSIPENMRGEIFREGVTTKGNQGTGMGLKIVSDIVASHHGTLELKFPADNEILFKIGLPGKKPAKPAENHGAYRLDKSAELR